MTDEIEMSEVTFRPYKEQREKILADPDRVARIEAARQRAAADILAFSLAELRKALDITQAELARRLDVTQPVISEYEHTSDPRLSTLQRYVAALGGHLRVLVQFEEDIVELQSQASGSETYLRPPKRLTS